MMHITTRKKRNLSILVLITLILLNCIYRALVIYQFSYTYTDNDQIYMWGAAWDFANGQFNEPGFYGQNYNSMLEALIAAPFYKAGIGIMYILPVVTSFLTLFPYFILSIIVYIKKQKWQAYLILAIPFLLPPQYDFITSLPRGFVTGIFFATLGSLAVFYQDKKSSFFFFAFCAITGYQLCPNSFLLTTVTGMILLCSNYKNKTFYIYSLLGFALGLIYPVYTITFYKLHPNYVLHPDWGFVFSKDNFLTGIRSLDLHLAYVTPLYWYQSAFLLFLFALLLGIFFMQKDSIAFLALSGCLILTIGSLSLSKAYDGDETIFLSYSRLFLALPLVFGLISTRIKVNSNRIATIIVIATGLFFFSFKTVRLEENIKYANRAGQKGGGVGVFTTQLMKEQCANINKICKTHQVELVVSLSHWFGYGSTACMTCEEGFPETINRHDRRTWRLLEERDMVRKTILFIDDANAITRVMEGPSKSEFQFTKIDDTNFILENNSIPTMELLKRLQIEIRSF